jgi:hypothetical protein
MRLRDRVPSPQFAYTEDIEQPNMRPGPHVLPQDTNPLRRWQLPSESQPIQSPHSVQTREPEFTESEKQKPRAYL